MTPSRTWSEMGHLLAMIGVKHELFENTTSKARFPCGVGLQETRKGLASHIEKLAENMLQIASKSLDLLATQETLQSLLPTVGGQYRTRTANATIIDS